MLAIDHTRCGLTATSQRRSPAVPTALPVSRVLAPSRRQRILTSSDYLEGPSTSYTPTTTIHVNPNSTRGRVAAAATGQPSATSTGKVGVVIVDHGSRKKASNEMLEEFGRLYGDLTGHEIVEVAHMEIAAPTIEDAVGRCAARGASTIVVAPYFLSRGRHIQEDIPHLVAEAQQRHPGLTCIIADPIGIDPLMVQLISNRVATALQAGGKGNGSGNVAAPTEVAAAVAGGSAAARHE